MGNSIPAEISIFYDDSGGTPRDITQHVLSINDVDVESVTEEKHSFGDSWDEHLPVGIMRMPAIELMGLYDDAANGPNALFVRTTPETPASATRTLTITWKTTGGTKSTAVETYMGLYKRSPDRSGLTKYTARLIPTGVVTEV